MFQADELSNFDAVILNNNCSIGPKRDLFYDVIKADSTLSEDEVIKKAAKLELNLLEFIKNGGGLAVVHGAIVMQNNSEEVSNMIGGSFDYHPRQQSIEVKVVDETHPISSAFKHGIFKHYDEPYFFKNAYANKNFRPLLYMSSEKIMEKRHQPKDDKSYISWIKKYGKGRVFYVSPSHNAQSYENKELLQFYLNGIQYVLGDLVCDDSPLSSS